MHRISLLTVLSQPCEYLQTFLQGNLKLFMCTMFWQLKTNVTLTGLWQLCRLVLQQSWSDLSGRFTYSCLKEIPWHLFISFTRNIISVKVKKPEQLTSCISWSGKRMIFGMNIIKTGYLVTLPNIKLQSKKYLMLNGSVVSCTLMVTLIHDCQPISESNFQLNNLRNVYTP
jgi:hypothetical protein